MDATLGRYVALLVAVAVGSVGLAAGLETWWAWCYRRAYRACQRRGRP